MSRDKKIDKINAYKRLIETKKLPKAPTEPRDRNADDEILQEFTDWAEAQLAKLLGEDQEQAEGFSENEVALLKAWATKLQRKIDGLESAPAARPVQQVRTAPSRQQPTGTAVSEHDEEEQERDAKTQQIPLGHRLKKPKAGANILDALDELDRRGPKF